MADAERNLKTALALTPGKTDELEEATVLAGDASTAFSGSSTSSVDDGEPPAVDAATRESWLTAYRALASRSGGRVRSTQLGDALRLAGFVVTEAEVAQYRAEVDPRGEGLIGPEGFLALAAKARSEVGSGGGTEGFETLRAALAVFDKPLSGRINAVELRQWLTSLGEPIDDGDVTKMLEHLVDEQGLIDYTELAHRLVG